jgi:GntR family transcriptional regulator
MEAVLFIRLAADNPDPLYRQVTDQIRDAIASGDLQPDQLLPSIRELALDLEVSVITVKRAYQDLESAGLIRTRRGLGTFVMAVDQAEMRRAKLAEISEDLRGILARGRKFSITAADVTRLIRQIEREEP